MSLVTSQKRCSGCGEVKPVSEFHRCRGNKDGLQPQCKPCTKAATLANKEKRRAEMGEEAFLEWERIKVRMHRQRTGNATGKAYAAAQRQALRTLKERHRKEYEHLLLLARRGELPDTG